MPTWQRIVAKVSYSCRSTQRSDKYLALSCRGDVTSDYGDFMDRLGVFDNEIDYRVQGWSTPLGIEVHAYLIGQSGSSFLIPR